MGTASSKSKTLAHLQVVLGRREFARFTLDDVEAALDRARGVFAARGEALTAVRERCDELEEWQRRHQQDVEVRVQAAAAAAAAAGATRCRTSPL